jgi:hypothetical protein
MSWRYLFHHIRTVGSAVGGIVGIKSALLAWRAGVMLAGLDAPVAGGVHGREVRVGDYHLAPE